MLGLAKVFYPGMPVSPGPASMETLEMLGAPAAPSAADAVAPKAEPVTDKPAEAKPTEAATTEGAKP